MEFLEGKMPPNGDFWGQNGGKAWKWGLWDQTGGGQDP